MSSTLLKEFLVGLNFKVNAETMKKFVGAVQGMTKRVAVLGASVVAAGVAIVGFTATISRGMERLYYASQRTRETVANMLALRYAAEQVGVTAEEAQGAFETFTRSIRLNPGLGMLLKQLGVGGNSPMEVYRNFIAKMKEMRPEIAAQYAALFGQDPDTIATMGRGLDAMDRAREQYQAKLRAFGLNPDEAAASGQQFMNALREMQASVGIFLMLLQSKLAPIITKIATEFEKWSTSNTDKVVGSIAIAFEKLSRWVNSVDWDAVGAAMNGIAAALGLIVDALTWIVEKYGKLIGWLGGQGKSLIDRGVSAATGRDNSLGGWLHDLKERWFPGQAPATGAPAPSVPGPAAAPPGGRAPIGIRNNNPGNLRSWGNADRVGGFARFDTAQEGLSAMAGNLLGYYRRGLNTVGQIINRWAPTNENNTAAYIAAVSKKLGVGANDALNLHDPKVLQSLMQAIIGHENGYNPYSADLISGAVSSRLGVGAQMGRGGVQMNQKTEIIVQGGRSPDATARAVASQQDRVNGDLLRNTAGLVR